MGPFLWQKKVVHPQILKSLPSIGGGQVLLGQHVTELYIVKYAVDI